MKPNFALSLSFEGIRLLHRAAGGWRVVGDVALDAADMSADLADLRRTALTLEPDGLRTKLLLPNAQIKYLTVDTAGLNDDACKEAARAALDGATPYLVKDLAFDISTDGARTHVAAVARETLKEAEGFALEHDFNPISFAAVPGDKPYLGEPFFGAAPQALGALADGDRIEPDGIAVVIIGDANDAPDTQEPSAEAIPEAPIADAATDTEADDVTDTDDTTNSTADLDADAPEAVTDTDTAPTDGNDQTDPNDQTDDAPAVEASTSPQNEEPAPSSQDAQTPDPVEAALADPETDPEADDGADKGADEAIDAGAVSDTAEPPVSDPPVTAPETAEESPEETSAAQASEGTEEPAIPPASASAAPAAGFASRRADTTAPNVPASAPPNVPRREPSINVPMPKGLRAPPPVSGAAPAIAAAPSVAKPEPAVPAAPPFVAPVPVAAPPFGDAPAGDAPASEAPARAGIAAATAAAAPIGRFLSRRKAKAAPVVAAQTAPAAAVAAPAPLPKARPQSEAERMTIFGARQSEVGGKPRFLGLVLTAALLVFLAGVAAWASVFLDDGLNLSRLFGDRSSVSASASATPDTEDTTTAPEQTQTSTADQNQIVTAALDTGLTPEDTAVLDALRDPVQPPAPVLTQREVEATYANTGIWPRAPQVPPTPASTIDVDDIYVASIDPISTSQDAIALPSVGSFSTDPALDDLAPPPAAGTTFALDAAGRVVPSATGALSPDGFTVFLGRPPATPPATLARFAAVAPPLPDVVSDISALAAFRPAPRPGNLTEQNERANLNGATRNELAQERPKLRPASVQEDAQAAAEKQKQQAALDADAAVETALAQDAAEKPFATATQFAIKASARPDVRPRNFARIVRRAQRTPAPQAQEETRVASRQVAPRVVTPSTPSKRSVARQATQKNAINLRKVNLIGVYGKPSSRRALVRLSNGRYKKVTVGDRVDGGRVSAISNSELRYTKGGRNVVLKMP